MKYKYLFNGANLHLDAAIPLLVPWPLDPLPLVDMGNRLLCGGLIWSHLVGAHATKSVDDITAMYKLSTCGTLHRVVFENVFCRGLIEMDQFDTWSVTNSST